MDRACEGDKTRRLVEDMGMTPVVPPKANRKAEEATTANSESCGTRSNGCSEDSRVTDESTRGSTSPT